MVVPLLSFSCLPIRSEPLKGGHSLPPPLDHGLRPQASSGAGLRGGAEEHDWWTMRREEEKDHFLLAIPIPKAEIAGSWAGRRAFS